MPCSQERQQTNKQQLSVHKKDNKHISNNYLFTRKTTIRSATIIPVTQERQQTDKEQLPIHKKDNKQISSNYLFTKKATNR